MIKGTISDIQNKLLKARKKLEVLEKHKERELVCEINSETMNEPNSAKFYGAYLVEGSTRDYSVFIGLNEQNEIFVACTCRGALEHLACYHAVKALDKHLTIHK